MVELLAGKPNAVERAWGRFTWNQKPGVLNNKDYEKLRAVRREAEKSDYAFTSGDLELLNTGAGFRSAVYDKIKQELMR